MSTTIKSCPAWPRIYGNSSIYSFVFTNKPRRFIVGLIEEFSICVEKIKCSLFLVQFLIAIDANEPE